MGFFDDDEEDEELAPPAEQEDAADPAAAVTPMAPALGAPGAPATGAKPAQSLKDLLLQKYAAAGDSAGVDEAKQNSKYGHMALAIGQGLENFARAPIVARGGRGADPSGYNQIGSMLDSKVAQAQQARQKGMDNVLKEHALGKQLDQEQISADDNDPNSEKSKNFAAYVQKLYPEQPLPAGSYAELSKIVPSISAKYQADQTKRQIAQDKLDAMTADKSRMAELRRQFDVTRADKQKETADAKAQASSDKDFMAMGKDLEEGTASSRSDLGKNASIVSAADRLKTLGEQGKRQPGGLDNRQIHEAAIAAANLVSTGTGAAQGTIDSLVPHSLSGSAAGIEEWLSSNPKGAGQQAFVDRMMETADREKQLASEKIKTIKGSVLQKYAHLKSKDPSRWADTMAYHFGPDAQFDKNGRYVMQDFKEKAPGPKGDGATAYAGSGDQAPNAAMHPQASAAKEWASANRLNPDPDTAAKARAILERLGQ